MMVTGWWLGRLAASPSPSLPRRPMIVKRPIGDGIKRPSGANIAHDEDPNDGTDGTD